MHTALISRGSEEVLRYVTNTTRFSLHLPSFYVSSHLPTFLTVSRSYINHLLPKLRSMCIKILLHPHQPHQPHQSHQLGMSGFRNQASARQHSRWRISFKPPFSIEANKSSSDPCCQLISTITPSHRHIPSFPSSTTHVGSPFVFSFVYASSSLQFLVTFN